MIPSTSKVKRLLQSQNVRDGAIVFASTMLVNIFNYLYHMICSRVLGVSGYGNLATLVAGYSIFNAIPIILLTVSVKFAAELHAVADSARLRALTQTMTRLGLALAGALIVVFAATAIPLAAFLRLDVVSLAMSVVAIAVAIVVPATRGVLQGVQDYRGLAFATIIECLVRLACGVGFAANGFGAAGAMAGFAVGSLASLAYATYATNRRLRQADVSSSLNIDLRRLMITSSNVTFSTIGLTVLGFIDVVLVKHFFSARDAGLYGVLSLAGKIIIFSVSFVPTILLPKAVERVTRGESAREILVKGVLITCALSAVSLGLFFAAPDLIVRVMAGPAFLGAAPYIFSYGFATSLLAATTLSATYNIGIHQFAFIPRLLAVCIVEILVITLHHDSIAHVVGAVICANALGLFVTLLPSRTKAAPSGGLL